MLPEKPLRGDYSNIRPDYTVAQDWNAYTPEQHALYRRLVRRQAARLPGRACDEFVKHVAPLLTDQIPRFDAANQILRRATGWEIVGVPGLIPSDAFFHHLAERRFPVTTWLREPEEFDYIVEPDVFHDFFGHVPLLMDRMFADYLQEYGRGGVRAQDMDALDFLGRLYWYTVEFGLIRTPHGLRAYGAGILSSGGELSFSVESLKPRRVRLDLMRIMRTDFRIDRYQDTYFVIDSFDELFNKTARDFAPLYEQLRGRQLLDPAKTSSGDVFVPLDSTAAGMQDAA